MAKEFWKIQMDRGLKCFICGSRAGNHEAIKGQCPDLSGWRDTTFTYYIGPRLPTAEEIYDVLRKSDEL
jgi:hypothetical protein